MRVSRVLGFTLGPVFIQG